MNGLNVTHLEQQSVTPPREHDRAGVDALSVMQRMSLTLPHTTPTLLRFVAIWLLIRCPKGGGASLTVLNSSLLLLFLHRLFLLSKGAHDPHSLLLIQPPFTCLSSTCPYNMSSRSYWRYMTTLLRQKENHRTIYSFSNPPCTYTNLTPTSHPYSTALTPALQTSIPLMQGVRFVLL